MCACLLNTCSTSRILTHFLSLCGRTSDLCILALQTRRGKVLKPFNSRKLAIIVWLNNQQTSWDVIHIANTAIYCICLNIHMRSGSIMFLNTNQSNSMTLLLLIHSLSAINKFVAFKEGCHLDMVGVIYTVFKGGQFRSTNVEFWSKFPNSRGAFRYFTVRHGMICESQRLVIYGSAAHWVIIWRWFASFDWQTAKFWYRFSWYSANVQDFSSNVHSTVVLH